MFIHTSLSRALHRLDDIVRKRGVWPIYRQLQRSQWWSRDRLEAFQVEKLQGLLAHAREHSPYYQEALGDCDLPDRGVSSISDLAALPILARETVQARAPEIRSRGLDARDVRRNSTGGSTGVNVHFWVDRNCGIWRDAATLRMWEYIGHRLGEPMISIWGSPMDQQRATALRKRIRLLADNMRLISAYAIGDEELARIAALLQRSRPRILTGYASVLDLLASHVRRHRVDLGHLKGLSIVSQSEVLHDEQRRNIEEAFQARVFNLYGCREVGLIGMQCLESGSLHVTEERLLLERLPSPDGAGDRLLITDLDNRAFPFIRYEIGDLAEFDEGPCPCGRQSLRLRAVLGRAFDVIHGPGGKAVGGTFWSLLLRTAVSGIDKWQVVQEAPDRLLIRISPPGGVSPSGRETILRMVREKLGAEMHVDLVEEPGLEPLPSGKHRFVVALKPGETSPAAPPHGKAR